MTEEFSLVVETVNSSGTGPLKQHLLATKANVVLAQEVRAAGEGKEHLSEFAFRHGWKAIIEEASFDKETCRATAGVAIFARKELGLGPPPSGQTTLVKARAVAAQLQAPEWPPLFLQTAYLWTAEGLTQRNVDILQAMGQSVEREKCVSITAADFNMTPQAVEQTGLAANLKLKAELPEQGGLGTCRQPSGEDSVIDFFLLTEGLAGAVGKKEVVSDAADAPHRPFRLTFKPRPTLLRKWKPLQVQKLPLDEVYGPRLPPPPAWKNAATQARMAIKAAKCYSSAKDIRYSIDRAYRAWAEAAEAEVANVTGTQLLKQKFPPRGRCIKMVTAPATLQRTGPQRELEDLG